MPGMQTERDPSMGRGAGGEEQMNGPLQQGGNRAGGRRSGTASGWKAGRLGHLNQVDQTKQTFPSHHPRAASPVQPGGEIQPPPPRVSTGSQFKAWEGGGSLCARAEPAAHSTCLTSSCLVLEKSDALRP